MNEIEVPVLIAGGGGAGLTASMLLSTLGVESHAAVDHRNARALFEEES